MKKLLKKKDMTMLYEFILLVAVISIVALLVFQINQDARDDITDEDRATVSVVNESVTPVTAGVNLAKYSLRDVTCGTISTVYNATNTVLISSGNYTQTGCVLANTTSTYTVGAWKVSYAAEYAEDTNRYNATVNNDTAVSKIPKSLKLLATAIVFGAVLFVILRVIPMKSSGSTLQ
jgi:competence protein ComGC